MGGGPVGDADDTSDDGDCILWLRVTLRFNVILSSHCDHQLGQRGTSDWPGYTALITGLSVK